MDETKQKYRLLYFLLNELSNKEKLNSRLEEIVVDQKLSIANPSLIAFKKAFQSMKRLTEIEKREILINFEKEINGRLEIVRVMEQSISSETFQANVQQLNELEKEIAKLEDQLKQLAKDYTEEAIDYIDNLAFKFKSVLDINQLNYDLNQLQTVLVKIRLSKAERTYAEYGKNDEISKLKIERDKLTAQLKQLNAKEQKLIERKKMIEKMDPDLVNNFKNLKNKHKMTEWLVNSLE